MYYVDYTNGEVNGTVGEWKTQAEAERFALSWFARTRATWKVVWRNKMRPFTFHIGR